MASVKALGKQKYWLRGLPYGGLPSSQAEGERAQKYWFKGLAGKTLFSIATFFRRGYGSDNDATESTTGTMSLTTASVSFQTSTVEWGGMRFNDIAIPQGATITSAYLRPKVSSTVYDDPNVFVYFENADNATAFTTSANDISNRARTGSIAWNATGVGAGYVASPNLASILQTVVNRAAWASGNSLVVLLQSNANPHNFEFRHYDYDAWSSCILEVSYICDVEKQVQTSADDAWEDTSSGGAVSIIAATPNEDVNDWTGYRFTGLDVPQGATIKSAHISIHLPTSAYDETHGTLYGQAADNAGAFTTTAYDISNRSRTTASKAALPSGGAAGDEYLDGSPVPWFSVEITAIVQEIVSRAGWASGNAIVIVKQAGASSDWNMTHYDGAAANAARLWISFSVAGGGQYTKTLLEAIALTDALSRLLARALSEAATLIDAVTKTPARILSDSLTLVDSLLRQAGKVLTDAIALVDTRQIIATLQRTYTEILTLADTILRQTGKVLADALTLVDIRTIQLVFTRTFEEATTLIDTLTRQAGKYLSEAVSLADTVSRQIARLLNETATLADLAVKQTARALNETVALLDSLTRQPAKILAETATLADTLARGMTRVLQETATLADTAIKQAGRTLSEAVALVDTHAIQLVLARTFTEAVALTDIILRTAARILQEVVALADNITRQPARVLNEAITLADTAIRQAGKVLTDAVALADTALRSAVKVLIEQVPLVDTVSRGLVRLFTEALSVLDTALKQGSRVLSEGVSLADTRTMILAIQRTFTEAVIIADSFLKTTTRVLTEAVALADAITRSTGRAFMESVVAADTLMRVTVRLLQEALTLGDAITKTTGKILNEAATLADSFLRQTARIFSESLALADTITKGLLTAKIFTEQITLADIFSNIIAGAKSIGNFIINNLYDIIRIIKQKLKPNYIIAQTKVAYIAKQEARAFTLITGAQSSYTIRLNKP